MALLSRSKKLFLNLFVNRCVGCGSRIDTGKGKFCTWCLIRMYPDGERMAGEIPVLTAFQHSGVVREMVIRLKFSGEKHLAKHLARLTLDAWKEIPSSGDTVFPVPVSGKRLRERGYNQAELLARAITRETGAVFVELLSRKSGESQIGVAGSKRSENISGKFLVSSRTKITGRAWLIDDVMTTGATITEIISTLSDAGINKVKPAVVSFQRIAEKSVIPGKEVNHAGI